ncbi:Protein MOR1 [Camellia lanceoleosa]|uniref:Protein MOR1 n=1 Tax=Camellia lanceoleosa TaxID=1840588 RepID=A0ACC0HPW3_9ERIC|nr:Protein MOR1 [Camellia lanceoleosa]
MGNLLKFTMARAAISGFFSVDNVKVGDLVVKDQVPYITIALMDAKLGTEGRKDLFDWLSRQLSGLSNFPDVFVSREAGSKSGYGLHLRTGIARTTGFPVKYYWKKVDELAKCVRPMLHRSGSPEQSSPGKMMDSGHASTTETRGFRTEPGIVEAIPSAHARPNVCTTKVSAERDRTAGAAGCNTTVQTPPW